MTAKADAGVKARVHAAVAAVADPEIPVLTIEDLGILREVKVDEAGVRVVITPTYSGCPATRMIESEVRAALDRAGFADAGIETVLSPPWTTDWLTEAGRAKLLAAGIAPPDKALGSKRALFGVERVACPRCRSSDTERVSEFGSTACKAHYRCRACAEPFDYFKCF